MDQTANTVHKGCDVYCIVCRARCDQFPDGWIDEGEPYEMCTKCEYEIVSTSKTVASAVANASTPEETHKPCADCKSLGMTECGQRGWCGRCGKKFPDDWKMPEPQEDYDLCTQCLAEVDAELEYEAAGS